MKRPSKPAAPAASASASRLDTILPFILIITSVIGTICAFIILYEKLQLGANASYQPSCDLNPVISCGSVMKSDQSHAFGFPNPIIGLIGFPLVLTTGMAMLAGAKFKRWYWLALQAGTIFGLGFVHWLAFQTTYRIQALCPYCVVVWIITITAFWYVLLYSLRHGHIKLPARLAPLGRFVQRHHLDILLVWLLLVAFFILKHFWYYFGRNL